MFYCLPRGRGLWKLPSDVAFKGVYINQGCLAVSTNKRNSKSNMNGKGGDGSEMSAQSSINEGDYHNHDTYKATPPTDNTCTKGISKSARNRFYAQTSRARHRMYVANLEKDRTMLLERLEKIEEENRKMRMEILEMRMLNRKRSKTDTCNISPQIPCFKDPQSANLPLDSSNYALSVLDLLTFPHTKNQIFGNPVASTDSPWPSKLNFKAPQLFLVDVDANGWRESEMNWKDNCWRTSKAKQKRTLILDKMSTIEKLGLLRRVKLAKLKIYLQQFGNNN